MNVRVRVLNGPETGRTVLLRSGQVVRFGRTDWADHRFPSDSQLGEVHFELRCDAKGGVQVRNLDAAGTFLDGVPVHDAPVRAGQKLLAGGTTFVIVSSGGSAVNAALVGGSAAPTPRIEDAGVSTQSICERFELESDTKQLAATGLQPSEFVAALIAAGQTRDAIKFQAFRLPKRHSVWWAWRCVSTRFAGNPDSPLKAALDAAHAWAVAPGDETARAAERAAESLGYGPAAAWVAAAAFWSSDNIAPPVSTAVAPADHLTGTAVSAALALAAVDGTPAQTAAHLRAFLELAEQVLLGADGPPQSPSDALA